MKLKGLKEPIATSDVPLDWTKPVKTVKPSINSDAVVKLSANLKINFP